MEIMIDIETLGKGPGCVVLEAGLVAFHNGKVVATHQCSFDRKESVKRGFTIDNETVRWWSKQGGIPTEVIDTQKPVENCLKEISRFIQFFRNSQPDITRIWSRGNFDLPILEEYFVRYLMPTPWQFWEHRELRTALDELGAEVKQPGTEHRALGDALKQVEQLINARNPQALGVDQRSYIVGYNRSTQDRYLSDLRANCMSAKACSRTDSKILDCPCIEDTKKKFHENN